MKQSRAELLDKYRELVTRYHSTLNLVSASALSDFDLLIDQGIAYAELISELSPAPVPILDLGSGAGIPGIPIALSLSDYPVVLAERRKRRASFLQITVSQLGLENVDVFGRDVTEMDEAGFHFVTAQAVASFSEIYRVTAHLLSGDSWLISRKGSDWTAEVERLAAELGLATLEVREEKISPHGSLVAVFLPGGSACPPSG